MYVGAWQSVVGETKISTSITRTRRVVYLFEFPRTVCILNKHAVHGGSQLQANVVKRFLQSLPFNSEASTKVEHVKTAATSTVSILL